MMSKAKTKPQAPQSISWRMKLPRDLHKQIESHAKRENRTINNMCIVLLNEALQKRADTF